MERPYSFVFCQKNLKLKTSNNNPSNKATRWPATSLTNYPQIGKLWLKSDVRFHVWKSFLQWWIFKRRISLRISFRWHHISGLFVSITFPYCIVWRTDFRNTIRQSSLMGSILFCGLQKHFLCFVLCRLTFCMPIRNDVLLRER